MKDILFRGKRVDNGEWAEGEFSTPSNIIFSVFETDMVFKTKTDVYYDELVVANSVGQYTGLKDKNGKKIFDGDIVRSDSCFTFKIEYLNAAYYATCIEVGTKSYLHNVVKRGCCVIGNLLDDSCLLELKKNTK